MLPTLTKLLGDNQAEVRQAAGESLVGVAGLMKPMDLGQHVLTIVLELAHDDEQVRELERNGWWMVQWMPMYERRLSVLGGLTVDFVSWTCRKFL